MIVPESVDPPRRVLIIKPSALGDVVTAMPILRGLRRDFRQAHIAWLVSDLCAPLIDHDSQLDETIIFPRRWLGKAWRSSAAALALGRLLRQLRRRQFDWVLDVQGLLRSGLLTAATSAPLRAGFADAREGAWLFYTRRVQPEARHTIDRNIDLARRIGIDARPEDMRLEISVGGQAFAEAFCTKTGIRPKQFILCAVTTTWPTKRYPIRHWRKVVAELARHVPVVLTAGAADKTLCRHIAEGLAPGVLNLAGQTSVA